MAAERLDEPDETRRGSTVAVIVGLPGVGKSTVGRRSAKKLGWGFVDLDSVVEERAGMSIREIFSDRGEDEFRMLETEALSECLGSHDPCVVATGGGVVLAERNRQSLKSARAVVWMTATIADLEARLKPRTAPGRGHRPLLDGDMTAKLRALRDERENLYAEVATDVLCTDGLTFDEVVDGLVSILEARGRV